MMRRVACWLLLFAMALPPVADAAKVPPPPSPDRGDEADEVEEPLDLEEIAAERTRRSQMHPYRKRIQRYLSAAQKKNEEGAPEEGLELLDRLNVNLLNPVERAYLYQMRGYLAYNAADFDATIENFENMLAQEAMPLDAENRIRYGVAQIYAALQRWDDALKALKRWFRYEKDPQPRGYYLLGMTYYQLAKLDKAIEATETAIDISEEPEESWLQLLAALFVQKQDYANATPVLEELVIRFPKKQYWDQLSLIYGARDDYRHSLAVQQVAYAQGFLTEDKELRRLVRSYLYNELPYPAAKVLEKGLADGIIEPDANAYEMLANSWIAAREYDRSLEPLLRAAELSEDGKLLVRLAQVYLQREEWQQAAERLEQALEKGGLEDPGAAELLLGIAYYENHSVGRARTAFMRARGYQDARAEAERWIDHLENEAGNS